MRLLRFFSHLIALTVALVLIAAVGFRPGALNGVGLGFGISGLVVSLWYSAVLIHQRPLDGSLDFSVRGRLINLWQVVSGVTAVLSLWEIVAVAVFYASVSRWLTLANGILIGCLAVAGLIVHERCTERVVHVIEIVERPGHDHA